MNTPRNLDPDNAMSADALNLLLADIAADSVRCVSADGDVSPRTAARMIRDNSSEDYACLTIALGRKPDDADWEAYLMHVADEGESQQVAWDERRAG